MRELWGELWGENSKSKRELGWKFCSCAVDQKKAVSYQGWHVSGPLALWGGVAVGVRLALLGGLL